MRKILAFSALLLLTACNTFQGIGEDIKVLGRGISRTAADVRDDM